MTRKQAIIAIQEVLASKGLYHDTIDGKIGINTISAVNQIQGIPSGYSSTRKVIAALQLHLQENNFDCGLIDGHWGSSTQAALEQYQYLEKHGSPMPAWRPDERALANPNNWPKAYSPEFNQFYGEKGESNLVTFNIPYSLRFSWVNQRTNRVRCHRIVKDSALRVFEKVKQYYGVERIRELRLDVYGGCYQMRSVRQGSAPSLHSWGIAFDFDPQNNGLHSSRTNASFARPEYNKWWEIWEEEGWISLGRQQDFDWMHVQAARLRNG